MTTEEKRTASLARMSEAGVRPSAQRLAILQYISSCETHPTADEIYAELAGEYPTLSRATVFSSLKLFAEKGLINDIDISAESTRYDTVGKVPHAHFMCRKCRRIFDIPFDFGTITPPDDFDCDNVNVFFKGICPECREKTT